MTIIKSVAEEQILKELQHSQLEVEREAGVKSEGDGRF